MPPEAATLADSSAPRRPARTASASGPAHRPVRIPHAPGLDGLRGLAVAAVVVFHAGPPTWLPGGFLGVSLFFTLSGYLITTLVLAEIRRDRQVSLGAFWSRRARRLLPALLLTCVGVLVISAFTDFGDDLRADLLGGLTYSSNWVQFFRGQSYAHLFLAPSPLTHLWSLAIEEQFYVVLPLVAWIMARRAPWLVRRNLALGALAVVVAGLAAAWLTDDTTLAYYSTLNRAPEIAIGVLLATLTRPTRAPATRNLTIAGVVAGLVTVAAWHWGNGSQAWVARGGLAAFAVGSAVLVRCASRPGPITDALSWRPLRALGLISYGLYLFHWPVVVLIDPFRLKRSGLPLVSTVHWSPVGLFVVRVVLSVGISFLSYRFIEQPARRRRTDLGTRPILVAGAAALVLTIAIVLIAVPAGEAAPVAKPAPAVIDPHAKPAKTPSVAQPAGPPRMVFVGDSLPAWMIRDGGSVLDPKKIALVNGTLEACDGAEGHVTARSRTGAEVPTPPGCTGWKSQYPPFFSQHADIAVLMIGGHAALDRNIEGAYRGPCDPVARAWYAHDVEGRIRYMERHADRVVLVLPAWADDLAEWIYPPDHRDRMDCVRTTLETASKDTSATTVDFARYLCPDGRDGCRPFRTKDGMHLDPPRAPAALSWIVARALAKP